MTNELSGLVFCIVAFEVLCNGILFAFLNNNGFNQIHGILNPVHIYRENKVNIFGCIILTIICNSLCAIVSVFYWTIKFCVFICTCGRTENTDKTGTEGGDSR